MTLNVGQVALLREIVQRRRPDLADLSGAFLEDRLSRSERLQLCEMMSAEFVEFGVDSNDEP